MQVIPMPGGMNHHHIPRCRAAELTALFIIRPSDIAFDGPRPRKSRVAAARIEPPNSRMNTRKRYELMCGAHSRVMNLNVREPDGRARPMISREASENVCARIERAAHGHEVAPIRTPSATTLPISRYAAMMISTASVGITRTMFVQTER